MPDDYENNIVLYNGKTISTDDQLADTDGDGLLDGEKVRLEIKYSIDGDSATVVGKLISDPSSADTDGDGIPDDEDTAPFYKGLAGGIVGKLSIVTDRGDSVSSSSNGFNAGHSFLIYESYVNDSLDLSQLLAGNVWDSSLNYYYLENNNSHYTLHPNCFISFGAWKSISNVEGSGIAYNQELSNAFYYPGSNSNNIAISNSISEEQLNTMINLLLEHNYYYIVNHNCSTVAVTIWNQLYEDNLSAKNCKYYLGLADSPAALYDSISDRKSDSNYNIEQPMCLTDKFS